jgi:hypothetical protein
MVTPEATVISILRQQDSGAKGRRMRPDSGTTGQNWPKFPYTSNALTRVSPAQARPPAWRWAPQGMECTSSRSSGTAAPGRPRLSIRASPRRTTSSWTCSRSVAGTRLRNCTALGTGDSDPFLIEHLALNGVSCGTASTCTAGGVAWTRTQPVAALILRLAGAGRTAHPLRSPPQDHTALAGVSCRTATACTTVGAHDGNPANHDFSVPLVEASS